MAADRVNAFKLQQQQAAMDAARSKQAYIQGIASGQRQFNPNEALAAGLSLDEIKGIGEFGNIGKTKVKDYREIRLPDGRVVSQGFDEYGQAVGEGQTPFKAPVFQDLGGKVIGLDPVTMQPVYTAGKSMTPGEAASNAVARANLGISQQRLAMDKANAGGFANNPMLKGAPSGYRWNVKGELEPIPGGPAAEGKPPTEFESKSRIFGNRAESSGQTFNAVEKDYSPTAVAAAQAAANTPLGLGGIAGTAANASLRDVDQKAMQAKRNWIAASLRLESGAVIGPSEFAMQDKTFFPQPGDSATVVAQKRAARAQVERELKAAGGQRKPAAAPPPAAPAGWSITPVTPSTDGWSIKKVN
ncbi:hypothetical protein CBM2599_A120490 [Cupriavidus taiwanensis]|nr:hypothetical protein CBM2599_A120490 [Cupriavidus taiwanensis]SOY81894.1 hypothetical protein CBM2600_A120512 [Cupriavidus taiwanensis]